MVVYFHAVHNFDFLIRILLSTLSWLPFTCHFLFGIFGSLLFFVCFRYVWIYLIRNFELNIYNSKFRVGGFMVVQVFVCCFIFCLCVALCSLFISTNDWFFSFEHNQLNISRIRLHSNWEFPIFLFAHWATNTTVATFVHNWLSPGCIFWDELSNSLVAVFHCTKYGSILFLILLRFFQVIIIQVFLILLRMSQKEVPTRGPRCARVNPLKPLTSDVSNELIHHMTTLSQFLFCRCFKTNLMIFCCNFVIRWAIILRGQRDNELIIWRHFLNFCFAVVSKRIWWFFVVILSFDEQSFWEDSVTMN